VPVDARLLAEHQAREVLLRPVRERLPFLSRIDAGGPDLVLSLPRIEHRDRIAVGPADDAPEQCLRVRPRTVEQERDHDQPANA